LENKYTKEDAISFGKMINKSIMLSYNLYKYYSIMTKISNHLDNQNYGAYILDLLKIFDNQFSGFHDKSVICYEAFMSRPIEDMPLYINGDNLENRIARWRLKVGK